MQKLKLVIFLFYVFKKFFKINEDLRYAIKCLWVYYINKEDGTA